MEDNKVDIYDNINTNAIKDGKLPEYIESVFKWQPHHSCPHESSDDIVIRLLEKDEEVISDSDFPWRSFIIQLTLCYELHRQNKYKESLAKIKECEVILKVQNSGTFDVIYNSISEALWHVTLACKAHLMLESGMLSEVNQALKTIKPPDSMDNRNLAGIYGIKAAVFMEYGFGGNKDAVEFAKLATIKDPKQAEWFFLYGKSLATCRRVFSYFKIIDDAEIKSMKEAVRLATLNSQKPFRYMLYLGNIYRECAFRIFKQNVTDKTFLHSNKAEQMDTINKKARDIYRTVIKHQSENARLLGRCCFGLLKMPTRVIDVDLINDVLEEAHRLAPNNMMILHVMGMFFERCKEDCENALKYYKMSAESGCYGAWLNLLKLKYHTSLGYDPMKEYNKILSHFRVTPRRHHTLCQIASYYLIQKRDVLQAVDYLMMVFDENPDSYEMQMFKANFISMYNPVNILKVLIQEIQFILKTKSQQLENEDKKKLRKFIIKVNLHDSTLLTDELNSMSPVENIIKISKEIQSQPNNNRKKQTMRAQQQLKKKKEHQDRKRRSYKLRMQQLFKKNRKEEKIRRSYVVSGLPVDVAMRIRQAGIEKERVSCFKQRSLSETRQEEVNNKSSYKEFKQNFEKKPNF